MLIFNDPIRQEQTVNNGVSDQVHVVLDDDAREGNGSGIDKLMIDKLHHEGEYAPVSMSFPTTQHALDYFESHPERSVHDITVHDPCLAFHHLNKS